MYHEEAGEPGTVFLEQTARTVSIVPLAESGTARRASTTAAVFVALATCTGVADVYSLESSTGWAPVASRPFDARAVRPASDDLVVSDSDAEVIAALLEAQPGPTPEMLAMFRDA